MLSPILNLNHLTLTSARLILPLFHEANVWRQGCQLFAEKLDLLLVFFLLLLFLQLTNFAFKFPNAINEQFVLCD